MSIAVHVSGATGGHSERVIVGGAILLVKEGSVQSRIEIGGTGIESRTGIGTISADDEVCIPIVIHIPCAGDGKAEPVTTGLAILLIE
jgi:hypothetical protein